jgi:hypothetical protein
VKTQRKAKKAKAAVKRPKTTAKAATGVRAKAARRTAEGKFTKFIFSQIGGKELPPFRGYDVAGVRCLHGEARKRRCPGALRKAYGVRYGVNPLFALGQVVATPGALAALEKAGQQPRGFLALHASGDWAR